MEKDEKEVEKEVEKESEKESEKRSSWQIGDTPSNREVSVIISGAKQSHRMESPEDKATTEEGQNNKSVIEALSEEDRTRYQIVKELVETEAAYMRRIDSIIKAYMEPLQSETGKWAGLLDAVQIRHIFSNIGAIRQFHETLYEAMTKERFSCWSASQKIADIFLRLTPY